MAIFQKKRAGEDAPAFDPARLPRHIAVILDGNGRWAKKRGLPRTAGHAVGAETVRRIANYCKDIGVEYLTLYAFPPRTGSVRTMRSIRSWTSSSAISSRPSRS